MNTKNLGIVLGSLASVAMMNSGQAQSSDALLDKLVQKGILTQQEAQDLREQADNDFTKAYQVKSGLPDWVTTMKLGGDFRGRYEMFHSDNEDFFDRHRFRYRLRVGAVATMMENFEAGFRLTSSEPQGNFGGDPISGNTTLQDNASKKFVFIDLAYAKWSPVISDTLRNSLTIGKMENPFVVSDMVFDADYTPEGVGNTFTFTPNDHNTFRLNAGAFVLDEIGAGTADPFLYGAQVRWDGKWLPHWEVNAGVGAFVIDESESLSTNAVPNINVGNTREAAQNGRLAYHYNPVVADLGLTYTLEAFPMGGVYNGPFPIRVAGEVMHNPAAPTRNSGWWGGVFFGKSGKRGTWDLSYRYKFLEADAQYEEFVDSDFGAFYPSTAGSNFALGSGYRAGTNLKGHIVRASYSPAHSLTFGVTYFLVELLQEDAFVGATQDDDTKMGRLQVDAIWKF
jgi:hypothetical protein